MRVLSVGEDPATVDYSKTPEGIDEAYIRKGLAKAKAEMEAKGWEVRECMVQPGLEEAVATLKRDLASGPFDVVLLGGGLKNPPERTELLEALVNELRTSSPNSRVAFDNDPNEAPKSVARQVRN
ncbi:MAG: hypothetical protein INR64_07100 [Caulobacteraceae bacterium]|nr:hypothetical protein [Caulobacter sp.]